MSGRWADSTRAAHLPPDWPDTRVRILRRDPHCTLALPGCTLTSVEVDHIGHREDHGDHNLRGVCHHCHTARTQSQAAQARAAARARRPRRRPQPRHPGLR